MTSEEHEQIRKLAERDSARALGASEARELKMLKHTNGFTTSIFMAVVVSTIAMGCGGAEPRATCIITCVALGALVFMWTRERVK